MSDRVTKEKMLAKLRELPCPCKFYPKMDCPTEAEEECTDVNEALCALIKHGPEVSREFVEKEGERLFQNTSEVQLNSEIWTIRVEEIIRDAGVTVRED